MLYLRDWPIITGEPVMGGIVVFGWEKMAARTNRGVKTSLLPTPLKERSLFRFCVPGLVNINVLVVKKKWLFGTDTIETYLINLFSYCYRFNVLICCRCISECESTAMTWTSVRTCGRCWRCIRVATILVNLHWCCQKGGTTWTFWLRMAVRNSCLR